MVADACHSLGGSYHGRPVGTLADLSVFSLHPVKHITTGEGGFISTDNLELSHRMRVFRNHGITTDHHQRSEDGSWFYEMADLGYNYRLTDFQCALGICQLQKLPAWIEKRQLIARRYNEVFHKLNTVMPLGLQHNISHAYHLYVIRLQLPMLDIDRKSFYLHLRQQGVGVNVHYIPVHLHRFYRKRFGTKPGLCPVAEAAYLEILSLPIFPGLTESEANQVIDAVSSIATDHAI